MAEERKQNEIFRKQALERISSPEQMGDYLRVTDPGIWVIFAAVILLLLGFFAWSTVGDLETVVDGRAHVTDQIALIEGISEEVRVGMPLRIQEQEYLISMVDQKSLTRVAYASVELPDGYYDVEIVVERIHPIAFLLK
ncbi:MAG: hypothetical protein IJT34_01690 [Butyrivibrio sp.]|nr:hypothetical protein [Butyrivibrio sp.]